MFILKQISSMTINNTYSSRWYSPRVKLPKDAGRYLCCMKTNQHIWYEILSFNWENFYRVDPDVAVYPAFWSHIKQPKLNYNSNALDSHIGYVCSTCWLACHRLKNPGWGVSSYYKWFCDVCHKNTYVTEKRDFNFPDFTEYVKTLDCTCRYCFCKYNSSKWYSDLFCSQECKNEYE